MKREKVTRKSGKIIFLKRPEFLTRIRPLYLLLILLVVLLLAALVARPDRYITSVYNGLLLFCTAVLPALFPFFFFTKLLSGLGAGEMFSGVFKKPLKKLYNAPPSAAYIFFMSILSGYPVGAKLLEDFTSNKIITEKDAKSIVAFTSTSGPLFIIGTVATSMFHNKTLGYLILLTHVVAALLNGFLYRQKKSDPAVLEALPVGKEMKRQDDILSDAIYNSVISVLLVGGYIAVFNMIADVFLDFGVIDVLAFLPSKLFEAMGFDPRTGSALVIGGLEVTRGCLELSALSLPISLALPLTSMMISFGGISIILQSVTFISRCKIKVSRFLLTKITHSLIALLISVPIALLL